MEEDGRLFRKRRAGSLSAEAEQQTVENTYAAQDDEGALSEFLIDDAGAGSEGYDEGVDDIEDSPPFSQSVVECVSECFDEFCFKKRSTATGPLHTRAYCLMPMAVWAFRS